MSDSPVHSHTPSIQTSLVPDSIARTVVRTMIERGITMFFGIPGGPACALFEAVRVEPGARLIESRHETQAAFAAALYARQSGRVPCVVVTAGPGVTNVVTGVASAWLDRAPMVVLTGDVAWATTGGRLAQDSGPEGIDAESILQGITCARFRVASGRDAVPKTVAACEAAAHPDHRRPALIVVPIDVANKPCVPTARSPRARRVSVPRQPDRTSVYAAVDALREAKRPLIVLGGACHEHVPAIRRLIRAVDIPFVTTPRGKGAVSECHSNALRNGGMAAGLWARRYTAAPVDAALALGTDLDDTSIGATRYVGIGGTLCHVDTDPSVFGRNLPTLLPVTADLDAFVRAFVERWEARPYERTDAVRDALADARAVGPVDWEDHARTGDGIDPRLLLRELQRALPAHTRFVTDIGEHMLFALHCLTVRRAGDFSIQLGLGSMGSGIGGAIGLAVADPSRPVCCVVGDGCMQMAGMEALVAMKERLPVLFVVMNDGRYNMVHHGMKQIFGDASTYDMPLVDFAAWAGSIGLSATRLEGDGAGIRSRIRTFASAGLPALIDVRIDASTRIRGGGRVEALQHMSMTGTEGERT